MKKFSVQQASAQGVEGGDGGVSITEHISTVALPVDLMLESYKL